MPTDPNLDDPTLYRQARDRLRAQDEAAWAAPDGEPLTDTTASGTAPGGAAVPFRATVEAALQRAVRSGRGGPRPTVGALVDLAAAELLKARPLHPSELVLFYRMAADWVRSELLAQARLPDGVRWRESAADGERPFDPREVALVGAWWDEYAGRHPAKVLLYALHRFAGRTPDEVAELVGRTADEVRGQLNALRVSVEAFRSAAAATAAGSATGRAD